MDSRFWCQFVLSNSAKGYEWSKVVFKLGVGDWIREAKLVNIKDKGRKDKMNKKIVSAVVVMFAMGSAEAATSARTARPVKVAQNSTAAAPAAATSTAAVAPAESPIGVRLYMLNTIPIDNFNQGKYEVGKGIGNFAQVTYKFGEGRYEFFGRQYWNYNTTLEGYDPSIDNLHFQLTDKKMAKLGDSDITGGVRLVVPMTENSQSAGAYEVRLLGVVPMPINKYLEIDYTFNPRFNAYTVRQDGMQAAALLQELEFDLTVSETIVPKLVLDYFAQWNHEGIKTSAQQEKLAESDFINRKVESLETARSNNGGKPSAPLYTELDITLGVDIKPTKQLTITPSLYQEIDFNGHQESGKSVALFDNAETGFQIELDAKF